MSYAAYIPPDIISVVSTLQSAGHEAQLVGGCVRDILLNRKPKDYDISTSARPEQVREAFDNLHHTQVVDTGLKYGTVTVFIGEHAVEVTTYRADGEYCDGRRPESVMFSDNPVEDVSRRDFSINGLMLDAEYNVTDFVNGVRDLKTRTIRCIGSSPERFREDALRLMRAVRLAAQLNFTLAESTMNSLTALSTYISNVSAERIRDELNKILVSNHPAKGVRLLYDTGLLECIIPELHRLRYFDQNNSRHYKDVFDHSLRVLESVPPVLELRLAALFHDVGKPDTYSEDENGVGHFYGHHKNGADITREVLRRLKYSNETVETVGVLVYEHMARNPYFRQTGLKRLINRVGGAERISMLFDLMKADVIGHAPPYDFQEIHRMEAEVHRILTTKEPMKVTDLAITGTDLIDIGLSPGPVFGEIMKYLLELVLDCPELNTRENLIKEVGLYVAGWRKSG